MTTQNSLRTWNCLVFAEILFIPDWDCWDVAHPVTVQCRCCSFTSLWRARTVCLWCQNMDV